MVDEIVGGVVSWTFTNVKQDDRFPEESVAANVTLVPLSEYVPDASTPPVVCEFVTDGRGSQTSLADAGSVTKAPIGEVHSATTGIGHVRIGGFVSRIVMVTAALLVFP